MKILVRFIYLNAAHVAMFYIQLINLSILLTKLTKTFPLYCKICLLRYTEVLVTDGRNTIENQRNAQFGSAYSARIIQAVGAITTSYNGQAVS